MFKEITDFIKQQFPNQDFIPLHEPRFIGNEKKYLNDCIDSTYVSYVGKYVTKFEEQIEDYTGAKYATATVNGTTALHIALVAIGVDTNDEVITQALTFVATANAISYQKAHPVFVDVDKDTMGMSPESLKDFLTNNVELKNNIPYNKTTNRKISACIPMHTFGHPCKIDKIVAICNDYNIPVVEDAAESLGSFYNNQHTGTFGKIGILSFNGNKTITCGGGGMVITNDETIANKITHLTTTAKVAHKWEYEHDEIGYNYRLSNVSAALGCAQMENLPSFIENKRALATIYYEFFKQKGIKFINEPSNSKSNYWLNAILFKGKSERDEFLEFSNNNGVMARPVWQLMSELKMFKSCQTTDLTNSLYLSERLVNIPSSIRIK
ncbi:MAG: LegC family aminotransferase [Flavobacteriales bacterium]|nr:LegC family aminotransferase [Flavobacteriales bacterium]